MNDTTHKGTALITGASSGIGAIYADRLARRGYDLILVARNRERLDKLANRLTSATGRSIEVVAADLGNKADVRRIEEILRSDSSITMLVNNAGIGGAGPRQESTDGYELRFAVNYLAGFALTRQLLPLLTASAPARIVNVSSAGQQAIDFGDVMLTSGYNPMRAYCQSKLAQIMFTMDLAQELSETGVTVNALHPATYMPTKMVASPISTIAEGVEATMRLITAPAAEIGTGQYYNGLRKARADRQAYDPAARLQLRDLSEKLAGVS